MEGEVNICGYDIVRRDRKRGGGGVCFFVKNSINFSTRHDLNVDDLENLCVEIQNPRSKPFLVVTWYRPPDSLTGIFESFEILLRKLDSFNIEYHLLGDINCNLAVSRYDNDTRKLVSITDIYGLHQLINEPTRITETSQTLIDLIYTNCPDKIVCSGVRHIGISDHSIVLAHRKLSIHGFPRGHRTITYRNFRKFNLECFSHVWDHTHNLSNPNDMWSEWKKSFLGVVLLGLRLS